MPPKGFECARCGKCCKIRDAYCTSGDPDDIERWRAEGREDILAWVEMISTGHEIIGYDLWVDPETGEDVDSCHWYDEDPATGESICLIQDTKPKHCREFPKSWSHAIKFNCEGALRSRRERGKARRLKSIKRVGT